MSLLSSASFSHNEASDPIEIHLVRSNDEDSKSAYYYVAVYQSLVKDLFVSLKCKTTDIEEYGVILAFGFGEPDEVTKAYIQTLLTDTDKTTIS